MILRGPIVGTVMDLIITLVIVIPGCSFILPKKSGKRSIALPPSEKGRIGQSFSKMMVEHPELTGITPLGNGEDAFAA